MLIDHARKRTTEKRGGDLMRTTLGDRAFASAYSPEQLLALDQALEKERNKASRLDDLFRNRHRSLPWRRLSCWPCFSTVAVSVSAIRRSWSSRFARLPRIG